MMQQRKDVIVTQVLNAYRVICDHQFVWVVASDGRKRAVREDVAVIGQTLNVSVR